MQGVYGAFIIYLFFEVSAILFIDFLSSIGGFHLLLLLKVEFLLCAFVLWYFYFIPFFRFFFSVLIFSLHSRLFFFILNYADF